jgi:DNA-binding NarL/FixJ family response regulator
MLERTLGEQIQLELALTLEPMIVLADRHQLEQILVNLALNARDAMPDGGTLTIAATRAIAATPPSVVIEVRDTGVGMAPEVIGRAFEPFFTTKARGHGTGLGLATVHGIVLQNNGEVAIHSVIGSGTAITVRLPTTEQAPVEDIPIAALTLGGTERILLVEDEAALRVATARLLVGRGYEVLVACDGLEALEVLAHAVAPIKAVVTDLAMPRMRGDELARVLAAPPHAIPVILMSGYDSGDAVANGQVLLKPVPENVCLPRFARCSMAETAPSRMRVLLVDDHRMFAESLARLLNAEEDIEVVGVATSAAAALALAESTDPQICLVDYQMPGQDGVAVVGELKRRSPGLIVLMLSGAIEETAVLAAIQMGCVGFLSKDRAAAEVGTAIRRAASGQALIPPQLLGRLLSKLHGGQEILGADLTERERQILVLLADGRSNSVIAEDLCLSVNTVRNYVQAILIKLSAHSKLEAVATAVREGVIGYPVRG